MLLLKDEHDALWDIADNVAQKVLFEKETLLTLVSL
jgi:hypothetical protein